MTLQEAEDDLDTVDASIFSGDVYYSQEGIDLLETHLLRWARELENIKALVALRKENPGD